MKLKRFDEFPKDKGLYFCINYRGYMAVCEFDGNSWYLKRADHEDEEKNFSGFSWIDMEF